QSFSPIQSALLHIKSREDNIVLLLERVTLTPPRFQLTLWVSTATTPAAPRRLIGCLRDRLDQGVHGINERIGGFSGEKETYRTVIIRIPGVYQGHRFLI